MNRGVLQNSPVQQMMAAGNPSWWPNINNLMRPPIISSTTSSHHHLQQQQPFLSPPSNNSNNDNNNNSMFQAHYSMNMAMASSSSWLDDHDHHPNTHHHDQHHQQLPESWSQLFLGGGLLGEGKKMETNNWEEHQVVLQQEATPTHYPHLVDVKQESSVNSYNNNNNNNNNNVYNNTTHDQEFQLAAVKVAANWSHQLTNIIPVSSPQSCVTSFSNSNNLLDFSSSISSDNLHSRNPTLALDNTSECNSTATGGAAKKAKIQPSSTQSNTTLKVRKEKLGDRITALHQLVSPFGKTDTASVLLEAIGYIRFLQSQIEALSLPYLNNGAGNKRQSHPLLNDNSLKRKGGPDQDSSSYEEPKDLRSRGLCLVPVSCTLHVGSDNGADYWAPATLGGDFR